MLDHHGFPFDQYQRYSVVGELISRMKAASGAQRLKVLDVGGFFRREGGSVRCPIEIVLPDEEALVVDTAECYQGSYVRASGGALPFRDASFDVVVTCDTLEHVPLFDRYAFVGELGRVARQHLILAAPVDNANTRLAEQIVNEFVRLRFRSPQPQLSEHIAYGLPETEHIVQMLDRAGFCCVSFPCEDLYGWLFMMLAKHYLLSIPNSQVLHDCVDQFHIENFVHGQLPETAAERSYRRFFVASRDPNDPFLTQLSRQIEAGAVVVEPSDRDPLEGKVNPGLVLSQLLLGLTLQNETGTSREMVDVSVHGGQMVVGELLDGRYVGQSFVSHRANLCRIDLLLATYARRNSGTIGFRLRRDSPEGPEVALVMMDAPNVHDNEWNCFWFPPQSDSQNTGYYFEIWLEGGAPGNAVSVYYKPGAGSLGMTRYEGGSPADGHLMFRSYFVPLAGEGDATIEDGARHRIVDSLLSNMRSLEHQGNSPGASADASEPRVDTEHQRRLIRHVRSYYEEELRLLREEHVRQLNAILLALRTGG